MSATLTKSSPEFLATIEPLVVAGARAHAMYRAYLDESLYGGSGKVLLQSQPVSASERANRMYYFSRAELGKRETAAKRISRIFSIMSQMSPEVAGAEGMIHDPYKAEHAAYAMKPDMDDSVNSKLGFNKKRLARRANKIADLAIAEYDKNPLNPQAIVKPRLSQRLAGIGLNNQVTA